MWQQARRVARRVVLLQYSQTVQYTSYSRSSISTLRTARTFCDLQRYVIRFTRTVHRQLGIATYRYCTSTISHLHACKFLALHPSKEGDSLRSYSFFLEGDKWAAAGAYPYETVYGSWKNSSTRTVPYCTLTIYGTRRTTVADIPGLLYGPREI